MQRVNNMMELDLYQEWCKHNLEDPDLTEELANINGDVDAIQDRFYQNLEFGTGGLRGVIGAGTNRMNIYTVRKATQGLANYLNEKYEHPSIAISYDSRIKSDLFAKEVARVMAANGVTAYIYAQLMPTPCLSFAVRELKTQAGVMITASHNPAKYNGYKAYGDDGCQMTSDAANRVLELINKVDIFEGVKMVDFDTALAEGKIQYIKQDVIEAYYANVAAQSIDPDAIKKANLKVVYTPLNGTGNIPVREILKRRGVENIVVVKEQELPDGNFPTCPFPNPEIAEALRLGLELCKEEKPDLLLATDPDADRVGIAVPDKDGNYVLISGNEDGAMMLQYICEGRTKLGTMPKDPIAVKTIVTTEIAAAIAKDYGVQIIDVLTGFKYIGEQIHLLEEKGEENRYIFGFEESYGYLAGTYVRDKDAVVASMLICEMAAFYKNQGKSLLDVLNGIYEKYGVYLHKQESFTCEGSAGMQRMNEIMDDLRNNPPQTIGGHKLVKFNDYGTQISLDVVTGEKTPIDLPKSNVLSFFLSDNAQVVLRPSGTEPKIKAYYTTQGADVEAATADYKACAVDFKEKMGF